MTCIYFQLFIILGLTFANSKLLRTKSHSLTPTEKVFSIKLTYKSISLNSINLLAKTHAQLQHKQQYLQFHKHEHQQFLTKNLISFKPHVTLSSTNKYSTLALKNYENTQYIGSLTLGTPSQTLPVIYDTGSSFTWVNSQRCTTQNCQRIGTFNSQNSKTYKSKNLTEVFEFGSGKLLAQLAEETLEFPGIKIEDFQFYEILSQKGDAFNRAKFAGIVGLGIADPDQEEGKIKPLIDLILPKLDKGIFSVYLSRDTGPTSEIMIGGFKEEYPVTYSKVDPTDYYWSINLEDVFLRRGNQTQKIGICENGCKAVLDTGTSYLTAPEKPLKSLLKAIDVEPQCSNFNKLPNLVYQIEGEEFELEPWEYTFTIGRTGKINEIYQKENQIFGCLGAFIPLDLEINSKDGWILGDIFISKFPIIYDKKNLQIGIQRKKNKQNNNLFFGV